MFDDATGLEVAALIRDGEVSPVEAAEFYLDRLDVVDPVLNVICHHDGDQALDRARVFEQDLVDKDITELPPFFGVPTLVKELDPVAGWKLCGGSLACDYPISERDGEIPARLRAAGFNFLGSSTSPEFGALAVTESDRHGITRNPWNTDHASGGSSGGSAASVAARAVPIAHGSDGGGSIRAPASFNGLVGLKASRGRLPGSDGLGIDGMLTKTVADTAAALDALTSSPKAPWNPPPQHVESYSEAILEAPGSLRIAASTKMSFPSELTQDAVDAMSVAVDLLESLGHQVQEFEGLPIDPEWFSDTFHRVWAPGAAGVAIEDESLLVASNQEQLRRSRATNSLDYATSVGQATGAANTVAGLWGVDFDIMLTPTNPGPAPLAGYVTEATSDPWSPIERSAHIATFTAPFNMLGLPAISLPLHVTPDGLPLGVQLIAGPWRDDVLLSLAAQVEQAAPWRHLAPPISGMEGGRAYADGSPSR